MSGMESVICLDHIFMHREKGLKYEKKIVIFIEIDQNVVVARCYDF